MGIAFVHTDEYMDDVNGQQALIDLADFLFQENRFIPDTADLVLNKWRQYRLWDLKYRQTKAPNRRIKELRKRYAYLLEAVFDLAEHPPAGESIEEYSGRLRGGVLEVLVKRFLQSRYPHTESNCRVYIDGEPLKIYRNTVPKTVDAAGVDNLDQPVKGELYECKVGRCYIERRHLVFIRDARRMLNQKALPAILISLVSFENRVFLQKVFKELGFPNQRMISCERLQSLADYDQVKATLAV